MRFDNDDEPFYDDDESQARFGWRAAAGVDLFFSPKWGLCLEYVYDHVYNLRRTVESETPGEVAEVSQSARFHGFSVGVVIPFK
jgi:opacity protein-like surface antigen